MLEEGCITGWKRTEEQAAYSKIFLNATNYSATGWQFVGKSQASGRPASLLAVREVSWLRFEHLLKVALSADL